MWQESECDAKPGGSSSTIVRYFVDIAAIFVKESWMLDTKESDDKDDQFIFCLYWETFVAFSFIGSSFPLSTCFTFIVTFGVWIAAVGVVVVAEYLLQGSSQKGYYTPSILMGKELVKKTPEYSGIEIIKNE